MSALRRFLFKVLPARWTADMEKESRAWMLRCPCGYEKSVWDWGGIRWKASGNPKRKLTCPQCGQSTWHECVHQKPGQPDQPGRPSS